MNGLTGRERDGAGDGGRRWQDATRSSLVEPNGRLHAVVATMVLVGRPFPRILSSRFHSASSLWAPRRTLKEFKLADIGEGITECEVIKWSVKPSSSITVFDPLCEVQSDKATVEITSPFDGTVKELLVKEGDVAKVGSGLCTIEVEEEDSGDAPSPAHATTPPAPVSPTSETTPEPPTAIEQQAPSATFKAKLHPLDPRAATQASASTGLSHTDILATPSVRHFARQHNIDLSLLAPGSGKNGRIDKRDVEAFLARSASPPSDTPSAPAAAADVDTIIELGRTRFGMWKAMTKSLEIPQFGVSMSMDLTALHNMMPVLNANIPTRYLPDTSSSASAPVISPSAFYEQAALSPVPPSATYTRLTFLPILMKTLSKAMAEWPLFRSSIVPSSLPSGKPAMGIRPHADISIALSTPTGLYTPTVQRVDTHSVYALASQLKHLAYLGRQSPCALTPAEMPKQGGTISLSNVGGVGDVEYASPVLVPGGGVAIVAIGRAKWIWDVNRGDGRGERRLKVSVSWSADHRVVEGAELVAFVETWRSWIETPERLIGDAV
ncbi:hypothetical protein IEO21_08580 [Rhodonia placenta]|uniref:Dihydrolipoamide acetyltransferase component of pyruvate dehydrogenase complex n=1 Tax=Rhodonia placenta TaxID=104341 RepID=A0A8H7TYK7_9APHY|nr:hypothetical protein IEO21_08580 [Postia placenta]